MTGPIRRRAAARPSEGPDVLVPLDPADARPLHRQVYDAVRDAILAGRLPPLARLPSTRTLAADLGVARNTVAVAFDQLRAEGYVEGRRGGGTRVRSAVPDALLGVHAPRAAEAPRARRGSSPRASAPRLPHPASALAHPGRHPARHAALSARGRALVEAARSLLGSEASRPVPFRLGVPALEAFPSALWSRLTARRWRRGAIHLGEGDPAGDAGLRAAVAAYVANARGARCEAAQVVVVSGAQQALDLLARLLLDPGDAVWVEDPGYNGLRAPLVGAGARLVPVPVDGEGLDVAAGERLAPAARLAYVTPSHQFPLGAVMSAPRRLALLAWARRAGAWVMEDDYDSEFRYAGRPLPCLQGLDAERRAAGEPACVIYIGTFSKTLVPGLRLGYLVLPEALVDPVRAARAGTERHAATLAQGVLADFIAEGHYARHVRRVRAMYAERQQALVDAASAHLAGALEIHPDPAGLHVVGWLAPGLDASAVARAALGEGVEVFPLARYVDDPAHRPARDGLVLGYAGYDPRRIRRSVRTLARVIEGIARLK